MGRIAVAGVLGLFAVLAHAPVRADDSPLALGRTLYFEGIGEHGHPVEAHLSQGQVLEGAAAACVSCHRRSGLGGMEGKVVIPPITASMLFHDGVFAALPGMPANERARFVPRYASRHAYTPALFQRALAEGLDSDQRALGDPMPRYALSATERSALLAWVSQLGSADSPEALAQHEFWLVLTAGADARRRASVRAVVEAFAADLPAGSTPWRLRVLDLAVDPDALAHALTAAAGRPFALLSGAAGDDWGPVEHFCEAQRVPCIFPSLGVVPAADPQFPRLYSQYLSEGLVLEARTLARRVQDDPTPACRKPLVIALDRDQADQASRAAMPADGIDAHASPAQSPVFEAVAYRRGLAALLAALPEASRIPLDHHGTLADTDACVVAWLPGPSLLALLGRAAAPASGRWRAPLGLLPLRGLRPPQGWFDHIEFATALDPEAPLRLGAHLEPWLVRHGLPDVDLRSAADAFAACTLTLNALSQIEAERIRGMRQGPVSRDEFIDALEQTMNFRHVAGVDHLGTLRLGRVERLAAHDATMVAFPTATAPEPRPMAPLRPARAGGALTP